MQYPLTLTFKLWAFAPQISVVDPQERLIFYVRQKLFRFKEAINVFADVNRTQVLYNIKADRIIDFSALYTFSDANGVYVGAVKRRGFRSLWRSRYDIFYGEQVLMTIREENPWVKIFDALFAEIPIVGIFTGFVFNPVYLVTLPDGQVVMRLEKVPAFLSRIFTIKQLAPMHSHDETRALLSLLMMLLLERTRG
ncbi:MAG: hypothetical protein HC769_09485 [Cyanobacteria bacterium CRU_2_1]|nr:hypothetical protein [Cyanobacteria bacterium RU_5_0]NJR59057.1 hypothetical protein [Cyanobacteria bacterium CRU_2_1]